MHIRVVTYNIHECYAGRSRLAREASDHFPVVAYFEIPDSGFVKR